MDVTKDTWRNDVTFINDARLELQHLSKDEGQRDSVKSNIIIIDRLAIYKQIECARRLRVKLTRMMHNKKRRWEGEKEMEGEIKIAHYQFSEQGDSQYSRSLSELG